MLAQSDDLRAVYPSLRNKRVLITGGGSGIGGGLVHEFCRQGADVTYFDLAPGKDKPAYFHQVDLCAALVQLLPALLPEPRCGTGLHRLKQTRLAARVNGPSVKVLGGVTIAC